MKSFVKSLQDRIIQLEKENQALKTHAPYGILTRAAFEIEKRKLTNGQFVIFGDVDDMHGLNTQYGYEAVNQKSTQYVLTEKTGNLLAEKNTVIEQQAARISELEAALSLALRYLENPEVQVIPFAMPVSVPVERARALLDKVQS